MRGITYILPRFFTAFAITSMIIASIVAVSVLGDEGSTMNFDNRSGTFTLFGQEYQISQQFVRAVKSIFDFNSVFMGRHILNLVSRVLSFGMQYVAEVFKIMYGLLESVINNSV